MSYFQTPHPLNDTSLESLSLLSAELYYELALKPANCSCASKIALFPVTLLIAAAYPVIQLAETILRVALAAILYIPYYCTKNDTNSHSEEFNLINFYEAHLCLATLCLNFSAIATLPYELFRKTFNCAERSSVDSSNSGQPTDLPQIESGFPPYKKGDILPTLDELTRSQETDSGSFLLQRATTAQRNAEAAERATIRAPNNNLARLEVTKARQAAELSAHTEDAYTQQQIGIAATMARLAADEAPSAT